MWWTILTHCLRIFTGCGGRSLRIVYGFAPDLGEQACGLFMDLGRIWKRRLMDCLRIFTECGGRSLRNVSGFLPHVEDEAYGLFMDVYRIWGRRLADCLWIWTGFGGEGLRIWGSLGAGTLKQQPASACAQVHWHTYSSDIQLPISIAKSDPSSELTWATLG